MNKECLIALQSVKHSLNNIAERADDRIQGAIELNLEVTRLFPILIENELLERYAVIDGVSGVDLSSLNDSSNGKNVVITLNILHPLGTTFIGTSWSKLLEYTQNLVNPPKLIYFLDTNEIIDEHSNDAKYQSLQNIAWVLGKLKDNSDYQTGSDHVFLHQHKVEIPLIRDENILSNPIDIEGLKLILDDEHHKSAKKSLFKAVICEMFGEDKKELRFRKLINKFDVFTTRFALAFHSYVSDYSFDKIRKEFEEKRTEYFKKVNDVFHDISSKLIILPAPLWLALSQSANIHTGNVLNYIQLYKNITIILITVAVSALLGIMILGQLKVLETIKLEYTNLFNRLQSEFPEVKLDSDNELKMLRDRHQIIFWQLYAVQIMNILLGIFSIVIVAQAF